MSILPPGIKMYFDPELSMPLGPARKREPLKADPFRVFESHEHSVTGKDGYSFFITEADCRQIKGAGSLSSDDFLPPTEATPPNAVDAFCARHAPPKFKVGQTVEVIGGDSVYAKRGLVGEVVELRDGDVWCRFDNGISMTCCLPEWLELISDAPPKEGEWITWAGGECPVPANCMVEYCMRGEKAHSRAVRAYFLRWSHSEAADPRRENDIVAYRVVLP